MLLMQVGEKNYETLAYLIMNVGYYPGMAKYFFANLFEMLDNIDYSSGMHHYIIELTLGQSVSHELGKLYPIRADLRITLNEYNRLRAPYRDRRCPFPEYKKLGS